jgi:Ser/Thr protein kinase RdoA (MazF antagonist)
MHSAAKSGIAPSATSFKRTSEWARLDGQGTSGEIFGQCEISPAAADGASCDIDLPENVSAVMSDAVGDVLSDGPPPVSDAEAVRIIRRHWGVSAQVEPLVSERDHNFRVQADGFPESVLKIAHPAEPRPVTNFQTAALRHIALVDPTLPVPAVIPSLDGADELDLEVGGGARRVVRLLTFLPGTLLKDAPRSATQDFRLGAFLARLNRALRGFFHRAAGGDGLLWDLRQIPAVRDRTSLIEDASRRLLVERVMDMAAAEMLPRLPAFRAQVVHNDFNLSNVVVGEDPEVIVGALDFGDMLHAPLICDIATAAAYRWTPGEHPLEGVARFARGFDSVTRLEDEEIESLSVLVGCRLALTLVLSNWQAKRFPEKIDYVLRGNEDLWSFLSSISSISAAQATRIFRAALERR